MFNRAIVVGASSGIGEQLVLQLTAQGAAVAAIARRKERLDALANRAAGEVIVAEHDVLDYEAAPALFDDLVERLGGLDLLVYCAGVMPEVEEGEYNFEKDRAMLEVNLLGAVRWLDLGAGHMEAQRSGTLVGISSVAGERGRRGAPVYTASKAGLTAYMEALRNRCHRYGVEVVTVKPGPVRTPMTEGMQLPFMIDADEAAAGVLKLAHRGTGEGYVPLIWWPIMSIIKAVPSFIFRKTNV
ncbi:MAG TPA: SDR family NAD(P)-dependent oxidoreductase [Myxococcota bacterium]|nr:SDR family NAD(P)-dependent oxidoreductase [Myxococcota bacterium]